MMLNCFTLNRKTEDNRKGGRLGEKIGGQICKEASFTHVFCFSEKSSIKVQPFYDPLLLLCPSTLPLPLTLHSFFYSPAAFPLCPESMIVVRFCFFLSCVCQQLAYVCVCVCADM